MSMRRDDPYTICPGCRTTLLHPPHVAAIKCPVCSTITTIGSAGPRAPPEPVHAKSICSGCGKWLMHPHGVPSIKCTICATITNLAQPQAQTNCAKCATAMMYPKGAPSVKCYVCHWVTSVPVQLMPNEPLIRDLMGAGHQRARILACMREQYEEGHSIDDKDAITKRLSGETGGIIPPPLDVRQLQYQLEKAKAESNFAPVCHMISTAWSSARVLNTSFLREAGLPAQPHDHGVDLQAVRAAYCAMTDTNSSEVMSALNTAIKRMCDKPVVLLEIGDLRQFLILLEHPSYTEPSPTNEALVRLASLLSSLSTEYKNTLVSWFAGYDKDMFKRLVNVFQLAITCRLFNNKQLDVHHDHAVVTCTQVLGMLNIANQNVRHLPFLEFYNVTLNEQLRPEKDFEMWKKGGGAFSFCHHPYMLNPATKSRIMQLDAAAQMESELQAAVVNMLFSGTAGSPFLVLVVRRDHIVQDTLDQIVGKKWDLKKKLKVKFHGEEGIDAGGVQKEFFQLIMREIFDPRYGMFTYAEDTRLYWFNHISLENELEFELIGVVLGLAIYNSVILDLHLPMVVYKKLMGYIPTLDDLSQMNPMLGRGLGELLRYQGNVENDMCRTFQVSYEVFDQVLTQDLKPNGADMPVTNQNRQEFVDLYIKWLLVDCVERQFSAFARGFHRVCGGQALSLFRPEELELLICGSEDLDFAALERVAKYENGYNPTHRLIKWFWDIVHNDFAQAERKKLLFFVTGSDRVPIKGLGTLNFVVIRNGGESARLPTSHTCFNQLLIPEYKSRQKLKERLTLAIENAEGFGLK